MNLVFYIKESLLLRELEPFIWIGDTSGVPSDSSAKAAVVIDAYDYFHAPQSQDLILSLDSAIMGRAWQWFMPFVDQSKRWSLRSKHSLESLGDWYIREVANQTAFLKSHGISALHFEEDPHRGRDFLACKLAEDLGIPVFIYETVNIGYRTFIKTAVDDPLDRSLVVPEAIRASQDHISTLDVQIGHTGVTPSSSSVEKVSISAKKDRVAGVIPTKKTGGKYLTRLLGWLRRQFIVPRMRSVAGRLSVVIIFFALAKLKRLAHILWWKRVAIDRVVTPEDIVFYAHYWPERTTNPRGAPFFSSQLVCLEVLNQTGRRVFFQEHPVSLSPKNRHRNRTAQSRAYRRRLRELMVPVIRPGVRGEHVVATMSGTVGLESALRGFKVVCFAKPWYSFLPNVHVFSNVADLEAFLRAAPAWTASSLTVMMRDHLERHSIDARPSSKYIANSPESLFQFARWLRIIGHTV